MLLKSSFNLYSLLLLSCVLIHESIVTIEAIDDVHAAAPVIKNVQEPSYLPSPASSSPANDDASPSNDVDSDPDHDIDNDSGDSCSMRVKNGECNSNPTWMLNNCRTSCLENNQGLVGTVGYFTNNNDNSEGYRKHFLKCLDLYEGNDSDDEDEDDENNSDSCENYASAGECLIDPGFMLYNCAKSCLVCFEPG